MPTGADVEVGLPALVTGVDTLGRLAEGAATPGSSIPGFPVRFIFRGNRLDAVESTGEPPARTAAATEECPLLSVVGVSVLPVVSATGFVGVSGPVPACVGAGPSGPAPTGCESGMVFIQWLKISGVSHCLLGGEGGRQNQTSTYGSRGMERMAGLDRFPVAWLTLVPTLNGAIARVTINFGESRLSRCHS